ncbi:hypothetical protein SH501x_000241 [Pirellulaceae bacterium SH501]
MSSSVPNGTETLIISEPSLKRLGYSLPSPPGTKCVATFTQYSKAPTSLDQLIRSKARLDSLAPKQGLLANWKRALAVKELLAWTVAQCSSVDLQTEEATLRFGVTCCYVSVNLPLPEI